MRFIVDTLYICHSEPFVNISLFINQFKKSPFIESKGSSRVLEKLFRTIYLSTKFEMDRLC
jgi:hypothetical protein